MKPERESAADARRSAAGRNDKQRVTFYTFSSGGMMDYRERRMRYEQQLRELRNRGFAYMLLRKGILEFGVWLGGVMMALTLVREYFATGLSARIIVASFLGGVVAAVVGGTVFGALAWRQSGRMEKTLRV